MYYFHFFFIKIKIFWAIFDHFSEKKCKFARRFSKTVYNQSVFNPSLPKARPRTRHCTWLEFAGNKWKWVALADIYLGETTVLLRQLKWCLMKIQGNILVFVENTVVFRANTVVFGAILCILCILFIKCIWCIL